MALGFGFNKAKVLASAERYVQQGKLNNAISEYEKIVERDGKELTVLNTIGDLYARLGQNDKAGDYFRRVGDSYAGEGFTVKAIAMYKKLTKLNPNNVGVVQRLAELYTQQGLYTDARQQYLQLADHSVKSNDLAGAVRIFQKMLEIDPDNVSLQSKLADLYLRMGHKNDARDIFLKAAQGLYDRGSIQQADQSLDRLLSLDPANVDALLMRAKIALDSGDGASAAKYFEKVPDIDSRADSLQSLLRAYILTNNSEAAEGIARKLATIHNDVSGIRSYTDFLMAAGNSEAALKLYDEYVDRLVVGDTGELIFALQGLAGQAKDNPASLERLRAIFQKAGANANIPEVNELLAHAYVQAGELTKARDLYKELAELEPSNPQHMQNYRQVMARLGEEPTARPLAPGEGSQALFVEEIEAPPPPPTQPEYPASLQEKINSVLTDAELFESYNKPQQAVAPLEGVLKKAPRDARINQHLLSVYGRLERFADAARCCDTLSDVYHEAGMHPEAQRYGELGNSLRQRAGLPAQPQPAYTIPVPPAAPETPAPVEEAVVAPPETLAPFEAPAIPLEMGEAHEIDLSSEWEAAVAETGDTPAIPASSDQTATSSQKEEATPAAIADLLEEIRFYLSQGMLDEACSGIARCESIAPDSADLAETKRQLSLAEARRSVPSSHAVEEKAVVEEPASEDATVVEFDFATASAEPVESPEAPAGATFEVKPPEPEPAVEEATPPAHIAEPPVADVAPAPMEAAAPAEQADESQYALDEFRAPDPEYIEHFDTEEAEQPVHIELPPPPAPTPSVAHHEVSPTPEPVLARQETHTPFVEERPVHIASEPVEAVTEPEPLVAEVAAASEKDILADFVLDLEGALPAEFSEVQAAAPQTVAAAASVAGAAFSSPPPVSVGVATSTPVLDHPDSSVDLSSLTADDTSSALSDLFNEFKEEVGEAKEEQEDPETHYNLGVAFKEMGLLDEAIGELQKVCKSIDHGSSFPQVMQAYTWLAGCFVEKGVPEASIKWYNKALTVAPDDETRTALHYDLASAYEVSGDRQQALKHFTEVYGTNIDYRDVAERIKALRA